MELRNWAGNYRYQAKAIHRPDTVEAVQEIVARSSKVKAGGTRHSFNAIGDSASDLILTGGLDEIISLDPDRSTVTFQGGIAYGRLADFLYENGYALANLASLPHISVAGACATATHGSGVRNQNLSSAVREIEVVVADGSLATFSRGDFEFEGAVVSLGALGVVTKMTLDVLPTFEVAQAVYDRVPIPSTLADLEAMLSGGYSVSLFVNWDTDDFGQVWVKRLAQEANFSSAFFGGTRADSPRHMIPTMPFENCTPQLGIPGPWHHRLPHFKMEFTPSGGEELQTEYFVSRKFALEAVRAVHSLGDKIAPLLYVSEIRTIASDNLWLSPAYGQDCLAIHFTWKQMIPEVEALLPEIEERLAPLHPRPHWGKIFKIGPEALEGAYPKFSQFVELLERYDPTRKFRNPFLDKAVFGSYNH